MQLFCLRHIPSGATCDVEAGVCWVTFASRADATEHIATKIDAEWRGNYEPIELPAHLKAAPCGGLVLEVVRTFTTDDLGRVIPAALKRKITVREHFQSFYFLDTCDVWTLDGWLVTAIQNDGVTVHLRRGRDVMVARMSPDAPLYFNPDAKARHYGYDDEPQRGLNPAALASALQFAAGLGGGLALEP